jgi:hypothetical protein
MASGMRLVVSCISSFLILSLLLFMVHRLRQRRRERIESLIGANCECPPRATIVTHTPALGLQVPLSELCPSVATHLLSLWLNTPWGARETGYLRGYSWAEVQGRPSILPAL